MRARRGRPYLFTGGGGVSLPPAITALDNVLNYSVFTAANASAYTFSSGVTVESVARSAGTADMANATTATQPDYSSSAISNTGALSFDDTDENLAVALDSTGSGGDLTMLIVGQLPTFALNDTLVGFGNSTSVSSLARLVHNGANRFGWQRNEATAVVDMMNQAGDGSFLFIAGIRLNSASDADLYANAAYPVMSIDPDNSITTRTHFYLGDPGDAKSGLLLLESLVTTDAMTDAEIAAVIEYWAGLYSITLTPSGYDVGADGAANSTSNPALGSWTQIGSGFNTGVSQTRVTYMGNDLFAVFENGTLYASQWDEGTEQFSDYGGQLATGAASQSSMCMLGDGMVVIHDPTANTLQAYRFHGDFWTSVGNAFSLTGGAELYAGICCLAPYSIAVLQGAATDTLQKYTFDGNDFIAVGNALSLANSNCGICAMTSSRIAVLNPDNESLKAYDFDGTDWSQVGNTYTVSAFAGHYGVCPLSSSRVVYCTSTDGVQAMDFDGTNFTTEGSNTAFPDVFSSWPRIITRYSDTRIVGVSFTDQKITMLEVSTS